MLGFLCYCFSLFVCVFMCLFVCLYVFVVILFCFCFLFCFALDLVSSGNQLQLLIHLSVASSCSRGLPLKNVIGFDLFGFDL